MNLVYLLRWLCVLIVSVAASQVGAQENLETKAAEPRSPEALASVRQGVERWIDASGLAESFEVQKLRWGARSDVRKSQWLKLELRFNSQDTDQNLEDARFRHRLDQYQGTAGWTLPETLFYKLVHLSGVPRSNACVAIHVLSTTVEILLDPATGHFEVREAAGRQTRRTVALPGIVPRSADRVAEVGLQAGGDIGDLPGRVQHYLTHFFVSRNQQVGLNPPRMTLKPLEPDYAGIEVAGIRRVVLTENEFWEQLQISIDLRRDGLGWRAVCHLDGKYASGRGGRLPNQDNYRDMDTDFRPAVERFIDVLLRGLQEHLASDSR
ncbi:MAG: hypothetical protein L0Z50_31250 [Verrucomicrobiales bacterium]|nr:hypothetical protein [Verrucomicrobiales bacterium]